MNASATTAIRNAAQPKEAQDPLCSGTKPLGKPNGYRDGGTRSERGAATRSDGGRRAPAVESSHRDFPRQSRRNDPGAAVRIDAASGRAWCGDRLLELMPKAFAILRHFIEHPERLLTKEQLFDAVWGDTVVSEAALTSCIRDLRRALADTSRAPRYIQTVHRRGFRFIGPVAPPQVRTTSSPLALGRPATLVERDGALARLHARFETASGGRRQLVFVTGEAGIGKTTVVEAFLSELGA